MLRLSAEPVTPLVLGPPYEQVPRSLSGSLGDPLRASSPTAP
jgi:hypothetical protein